MTRSQRLAALAAGALLLVAIPVTGAHQAPPPDLGEPVVVDRTEPGPGSSPVPSPDIRPTRPAPARAASPSVTTWTPDDHGGEETVVPAGTAAQQPQEPVPDRTDTARPVSPKPPVPAGRAADDDMTPEATAGSDVPSTPSASASDDGGDDGDDDDTGEDG